VTRDQLIETMARAICLHRAAPACDCRAKGVCKGLIENLMSEHSPLPDQATAALTAIEAAGMRVVPVEPTKIMMNAGWWWSAEAKYVYSAMINAAQEEGI
jgi:hypothetical protein